MRGVWADAFETISKLCRRPVGVRLAREDGSSAFEMVADSTGPFAGKPRSNN